MCRAIQPEIDCCSFQIIFIFLTCKFSVNLLFESNSIEQRKPHRWWISKFNFLRFKTCPPLMKLHPQLRKNLVASRYFSTGQNYVVLTNSSRVGVCGCDSRIKSAPTATILLHRNDFKAYRVCKKVHQRTLRALQHALPSFSSEKWLELTFHL